MSMRSSLAFGGRDERGGAAVGLACGVSISRESPSGRHAASVTRICPDAP